MCKIMQDLMSLLNKKRGRRDLELQVKDGVSLKTSPINGVMRVNKNGKISPRHVRPYEIVRKVGQVAYELELPPDLEIFHPVFHASVLRKYAGNPTRIVSVNNVQVTERLAYDEKPIAILDR